jgi:hypothetical protein
MIWYQKKQNKTWLSLALILALGLIYLMALFGDVFFHPNNYWGSQVSDGTKNYYTYQYSIASEQLINFQGFNYPYGECFFFLDPHPALSAIFHGLNQVFPGLDEYTVGVLNFLLMFINIRHILMKRRIKQPADISMRKKR